ncbi:hypothetical protein TNCV_531451 [Trichonephila clavipes]|nr:hypothetical protein TNCV_531451 [Trichonephila clavipes]
MLNLFGRVRSLRLKTGASYAFNFNRSFEHHAGSSMIGLGSTPILKNTAVRGFPPLMPFHPPHERTCTSRHYQTSMSSQEFGYAQGHSYE